MIETSIKKVKDGTKIANATSKALNEIVIDVTKASDLVQNIATASYEQSSGVEQINQGINQIANVVQSTSATSEQTASASEELFNQAELLKNEVATFKFRDNETESLIKNKTNLSETNSNEIHLTNEEFGKY
ncbi:Primosomal replication protein priC [Clostridium grantii DSM 8605]|uniref:Primosomal replication protein priC n=2 Tax=Clostridium TaxID=1485 RepID=A0A1M5XAJ3_9CLOT|nr:Primosomal replication protein priC [Clostridium grantii DSM 8605]